jgi:hypothetical protein
MKIMFHPVRSETALSVERHGERLILNGTEVDFSDVRETTPADTFSSPWLVGDVHRRNGVLEVGLILPHGPGAPDAVRFPDAVVLTGDGPVSLPGD